jgi:biopolymer transport protein ExbB
LKDKPMEINQNITHFLNQTDKVGQVLFALLILMSITSWFFIVVKTSKALLLRWRSKHFLNFFWNADSLQAVAQALQQHPAKEPFAHLTYHAMNASRHHAAHGQQRLAAGSANEFLTRAIRRVIDEETAQLEWGLTLLASIASTAPFIGLFGTVWGVYHALITIGQTGQGTLDKIAGPVGEALIMTGLGLAVAIPAVLAYNAYGRSNRLVLAQLDAFAHDLFAFLTTGSAINPSTDDAHFSMVMAQGEH